MSNPHYKRIWKVVSLIPEGQVCSYGIIADLAGMPGRARLVSKALKAAPVDLHLPWHRVINAQRTISFPAASPGYKKQHERLAEEGILFSGKRIDKHHLWQPDLATLLWQLDY